MPFGTTPLTGPRRSARSLSCAVLYAPLPATGPQLLHPLAHHREEANFLDIVPGDNPRPPKPRSPYTRDELLEYWRVCDEMIHGGVDALDLSAPQCGFPWYKMPTLEHQILNIRHTQHHAAALATRLRRTAGIGVDWVGGDEVLPE